MVWQERWVGGAQELKELGKRNTSLLVSCGYFRYHSFFICDLEAGVGLGKSLKDSGVSL